MKRPIININLREKIRVANINSKGHLFIESKLNYHNHLYLPTMEELEFEITTAQYKMEKLSTELLNNYIKS